jgi:hypothetical protein
VDLTTLAGRNGISSRDQEKVIIENIPQFLKLSPKIG